MLRLSQTLGDRGSEGLQVFVRRGDIDALHIPLSMKAGCI
jgi:hypothetical protein